MNYLGNDLFDANNRRIGMTDFNSGITTYTWTDDDQLAGVATPSNGSVTNTYNGDGLRFSRQDSAGTSSLLWDGIAAPDLLAMMSLAGRIRNSPVALVWSIL